MFDVEKLGRQSVGLVALLDFLFYLLSVVNFTYVLTAFRNAEMFTTAPQTPQYHKITIQQHYNNTTLPHYHINNILHYTQIYCTTPQHHIRAIFYHTTQHSTAQHHNAPHTITKKYYTPPHHITTYIIK